MYICTLHTVQSYFVPVDEPLGGVTNRTEVVSLLTLPTSMLMQMLTCALGPSVASYVISAKPTWMTVITV